MSAPPVIPRSIFDYLLDLELNNNREWFHEHKDRFEAEYREPALAFIAGMAPGLRKVSPHFLADPRKAGGSLFRIYRDVRFSRDKRPYKTHCGIHFRHRQGKDVHCPGYYLHLSLEECFLGLGIWHPEKEVLAQIRDQIDRDGAGWRRAARGQRFTSVFHLGGESLKRAPKGWTPDHPLIEDLRRKDFIAIAPLDPDQVLDPEFHAELLRLMKAGTPLMRWLCKAVGAPF